MHGAFKVAESGRIISGDIFCFIRSSWKLNGKRKVKRTRASEGVTATAARELQPLTECLDFPRRVSEARAANAVSKNLFLWRIFWCHTVILSLSPGRTALFQKHNTLNSQRFTLVSPHPPSNVCTVQLLHFRYRFKVEGKGLLRSGPAKADLLYPLGCHSAQCLKREIIRYKRI